MTKSAWITVFSPTPVAPAIVEDRGPRKYQRTAPHIRGRVYLMRPARGRTCALWGMQVINTRTGKILASDNCVVYSKTIDCCDEATAAARAAWFWGYRQKTLQ